MESSTEDITPLRSGDWRGSTGTLWNAPRSSDSFAPSRPVSATPSDHNSKITPKSKRRGGLRKKFRSLTDGLASFISGDKKEKDAESVGVPKKLRKSIFYVDRWHSNDKIQHSGGEFLPYEQHFLKNSPDLLTDHPHYGYVPAGTDLKSDDYNNPWNIPRLTRSMSQGSGRTAGGGGVRSVKAPPSPPPRRYTLWGIGPNREEAPDLYTASKNAHLLTSSTYQTIREVPPPPISYLYPPGSPVFEPESSLVLTPPRTPLLFGSPTSWSTQHPSTLSRNYHIDLTAASSPSYGRYCASVQEAFRSPSRVVSPACNDDVYNDLNLPVYDRQFGRNVSQNDTYDAQNLSEPYKMSRRRQSKPFYSPDLSVSSRLRQSPSLSDLVSKSPARSSRVSKSPSYSDKLSKGTPNTFRASKSPSHSERVTKSPSLSGRVSKSPSQDRKSSLFGLGVYRGEWYRRKAAKARLHLKPCTYSTILPSMLYIRKIILG